MAAPESPPTKRPSSIEHCFSEAVVLCHCFSAHGCVNLWKLYQLFPVGQQKKTEFLRHFSETLKAIRIRRGWNQEELAHRLGIPASNVGNYESMLNGPTPARLRKIADRLGVSVEYLTTGEPSPFPPATKVIGNDVRRADKPMVRQVPVVSWVRAGEADYNYDDLCNYLEETLPTDTTDPNAFAVIVEGDSMEPKFSPGDRLILTPNIAARNGDLVIARLKESGAVLFKRFFQTGPQGEIIKLTSYNPVYPELQYHLGEFRFIYRVHQVIHWPNR